MFFSNPYPPRSRKTCTRGARSLRQPAAHTVRADYQNRLYHSIPEKTNTQTHKKLAGGGVHRKGLRAPCHRRRVCGLCGAVVKVARRGRGSRAGQCKPTAGVAGKGAVIATFRRPLRMAGGACRRVRQYSFGCVPRRLHTASVSTTLWQAPPHLLAMRACAPHLPYTALRAYNNASEPL